MHTVGDMGRGTRTYFHYRIPRRLAAIGCRLLAASTALLLAQELIRHAEGAEPAPSQPDQYAWRSLFDGKSLKGWKAPQFGGEGEVTVKDGCIQLAMGNSMSGVTYTGPLPKIDYELTLEGKRTNGNDFFCTTTFPVGKSPCSLVVGGWGGTVVGLSCIDFYDASDNPTTKFMDFKNNRWYRVRIRVTDAKIEAWIDDEKQVDMITAGHKVSIRDECDLCQPLGVASWSSEAMLRNIRIRKLKPAEVKQIAEESKKVE